MDASPHEHELEPVRGLPEPLPATERILWQGPPQWRRLAIDAFHIRKVAIYFAALVAWTVIADRADGLGWAAGGRNVLATLVAAALAFGLIAVLARLTARSSLYTITDRRVVMRIGIVLTVTYNLPFRAIESASLACHADGTGDLALTLGPKDRIAWLQLWPHVRPWRARRPEPTLRALAAAQPVAELLGRAMANAEQSARASANDDRAAPVTSVTPETPALAAVGAAG